MFRESSVIRLRETRKLDMDFVCGLESLEENSCYIIPWKREQHVESLRNKDILHIIIEDKLSDSVVGYMILGGLMDSNKSVELIRITVGPKGKGYGKEAFKLLKDWVFHDFNANRLWLDVKVGNSRAIHLYKSQGFVIEGTLRECLLSRDGYESLHIMSILRREFDISEIQV